MAHVDVINPKPFISRQFDPADGAVPCAFKRVYGVRAESLEFGA